MTDHTPLDPEATLLTTEERETMHAEMRAYVAMHPVRERAPFFAPRFLRLALPVAAFVMLCGGTAFAAEQSLPNDLLYPVKVGMLEPAFSSLAVTPTQEAEINSILVERRFEEAEQLLAQGELDPATASDLQQRTTRHIAAAQAAIRETADGSDVQSALQIGSDLQATIDGHLEAMANISDGTPDSATKAFTDAVSDQGDAVESLNDANEDRLASSTPAENNAYAHEARTAADEAIAALTDKIAQPTGDADLDSRCNELLLRARDSYRAADASLAAHDDDAAAAAFQEAVQAATQGTILHDSADETGS